MQAGRSNLLISSNENSQYFLSAQIRFHLDKKYRFTADYITSNII